MKMKANRMSKSKLVALVRNKMNEVKPGSTMMEAQIATDSFFEALHDALLQIAEEGGGRLLIDCVGYFNVRELKQRKTFAFGKYDITTKPRMYVQFKESARLKEELGKDVVIKS